MKRLLVIPEFGIQILYPLKERKCFIIALESWSYTDLKLNASFNEWVKSNPQLISSSMKVTAIAALCDLFLSSPNPSPWFVSHEPQNRYKAQFTKFMLVVRETRTTAEKPQRVKPCNQSYIFAPKWIYGISFL